MFFVINVVVPSKEGNNTYPECAVNKYPIVICGASDVHSAVSAALPHVMRYVASEHVFDITTLYIRCIDGNIKEDTMMQLNEITQWKHQ